MSDEIDSSVKKVTTDGQSVERFDPTTVDEHEERVAGKKAMAHPSRGLMITRLKFPRATGRQSS